MASITQAIWLSHQISNSQTVQYHIPYLRVETDLADITGNDWPFGLHQWDSKGVVDHCLLNRIHLNKEQKEKEGKGKGKGYVKLNSDPAPIRQTRSLILLMERSRWQYSGSRTWLKGGHMLQRVRTPVRSSQGEQLISCTNVVRPCIQFQNINDLANERRQPNYSLTSKEATLH